MTLTPRQLGQPSRRDVMAKLRKLTDQEESIIVQHILDLDPQSFPPRMSDVKDMASRLLEARGVTHVGTNWISRFITRHPELKARFLRQHDYQTPPPVSLDQPELWASKTAKLPD